MPEVIHFQDGEVEILCDFQQDLFHIRFGGFCALHAVNIANDSPFDVVEYANLLQLMKGGIAGYDRDDIGFINQDRILKIGL